MTIAAGFVCSDGILLCADSQYSAFGKEYRNKLFYESAKDAAWGFAIVGDEDYARTAVADSNEAVFAIPPERRDTWAIRKAIRRAIKSVIADYKRSGRDQSQQPEVLIAITAQNNAILCSSSDTAFLPVKEPFYAVRGTGSYIANYIMQTYLRGEDIRGATVSHVLPIALHILSAAKRTDISCGGGAQFMMLSRAANMKALFENSITDEVDKHVVDYEFNAASLLAALEDLNLSDLEFAKRLEQFGQRINALRRSLFGPNNAYKLLTTHMQGRLFTALPLLDLQPTTADPSPPPPSPESPEGSGES
jgi:hypothetical protein